MNELRIAVGLLGCTALLLAVAPAAPTLLKLTPPSVEEALQPFRQIETTPPMTRESVVTEDTRQAAATVPMRAVEPAPYAGGDLAALPRVSPPVANSQEPSGASDLELFNRPVAVDAGTMKAGRTTLRVAGIDPISPDARCSDGPQTWPCGVRARTAFRSWLRGRSVLCAVPPDQQGAADLTVSCAVGESDIGEWLVVNGWASATDGSRYADLGETAKTERRGIWAFDVRR